jgi:hypothetical protein
LRFRERSPLLCYILERFLCALIFDGELETERRLVDRLSMGVLQGLLNKIGFPDLGREYVPVRVLLLDDDVLRHEWFAKQFKRDVLDVASDPPRAIELLSENRYDVIFLDHDLLPEHYYADGPDDERTGYAVANWLASRPDLQAASSIVVHTRNADGALRMVELLRNSGRQAEHVPFHMLLPKIKHYRGR